MVGDAYKQHPRKDGHRKHGSTDVSNAPLATLHAAVYRMLPIAYLSDGRRGLNGVDGDRVLFMEESGMNSVRGNRPLFMRMESSK